MLTPQEQQELETLRQLNPQVEQLLHDLEANDAQLDAEIATLMENGESELTALSVEADQVETQAHAMAEEDELASARTAFTPSTTPPNTAL